MERSGKEAWDALTKAKQTLTAGLAELDIATYRVRETPPRPDDTLRALPVLSGHGVVRRPSVVLYMAAGTHR